jgi:hypothetical protein
MSEYYRQNNIDSHVSISTNLSLISDLVFDDQNIQSIHLVHFLYFYLTSYYNQRP